MERLSARRAQSAGWRSVLRETDLLKLMRFIVSERMASQSAGGKVQSGALGLDDLVQIRIQAHPGPPGGGSLGHSESSGGIGLEAASASDR